MVYLLTMMVSFVCGQSKAGADLYEQSSMMCTCFCKDGQQRDKRNIPEETCFACNSIINIKMFLLLLIALCVLVMMNLLTTNAHLSSIYKVSSKLRTSMHEFLLDETKLINSLYKKHDGPMSETAKQNGVISSTTLNLSPTKPTKKAKNPTPRPDACTSCFEHNFKYIIDNPDICKIAGDSGSKIDMLILIFTTHNQKLNRDTIRETWISVAKNNTGNIRYAFLLGYTRDHVLQRAVEGENSVHHDILQEDFIDAYMNLTYKTMMAYKWASQKCNHTKFVMKTDDDMWVNTNSLLSVSKQNEDLAKKSILGSCARSAGPIRDRNSKWYASVQSYPGRKYPGFCSGTGYVTSIVMAKKVFEISRHVPFFHLEDVYVALCVRKLGLSLTPTRGFNPGNVRPHDCKYKSKSVITSHYMSPKLVRKIWDLKC